MLLAILSAGCQSAPLQPEPTKTAASKRIGDSMKRYFANTLSLVKPDTNRYSPNPSVFAVAAQQQSPEATQIAKPSTSLYQAGAISPAPQLLEPAVAEKPSVQEIAANEKPKNVPKSKVPKIEEEPLEDENVEEEIVEVKPKKKTSTAKKKRKIEFEPEYEDDADETELADARSYDARVKQADVPQPPSAPVYPNLAQLPNAPQVVQTNYNPPIANNFVNTNAPQSYGAGDWHAPLKTAADQLRYAIEHTPNGKTAQNEMRLRLIEMMLGNKGEAAKSMTSADKTVNEFFGHQILGFSELLEEQNGVSPNSKTRYISASYRFRESLAELSKLCPVKIKTVALVKDWLEYGIYMPRNEDYKPGEMFTVYMELDNPTIRRTADGHNISVALSYELRDGSANVVFKQDAGKPTLTTQSRKQDFCLAIEGQIPKTLQPGTYQLRISLTDLNDDTMQYTEEQIPLKVAPATEIPE
ncbi:hypothetical protein FACS1894170_00900 [Planctomycetales bacterium]|nr:hypothetical protein FACS1894170_00900 [Planctomycetales bacterium]